MIVVSNATPLIGLARIGRLALLNDLFGTLLVPHAVYAEVVGAAPDRPGAEEVQRAAWIEPRTLADRTPVDYLRADLDSGEAEVLVLARTTAADLVLLDEPKARLAAELLGLRYVGTVGILVLAKQRGLVDRVSPLLDDLIARRFHLSGRVYRAVLERVGED